MTGTMIYDTSPSNPSEVQTRVLQVASTFTSRPLAKTLQGYLAGAGLADAVEFVEYGHVAEYMLGPASGAENILGTLVLVRVEDSLRSELKNAVVSADTAAKALLQLKVNVDEFAKQITTLSRHGKPVWLLPCPSYGW